VTTVYLVRHATHALVDRILCGRSVDVGLDAAGRAQAERLAAALAERPVALLQASPRRRALETAAPIARRLELEVEIAEPFDELDAGEWSGRAFAELEADARWHAWNARRGSARPPGGESMRALRDRVVAHLDTLRGRAGAAVIVSHAEPIRAALLHARGLPLDRFAEIAVEPASITALHLSSRAARAAPAEAVAP
jgi:probable phosphoglycerate mutase